MRCGRDKIPAGQVMPLSEMSVCVWLARRRWMRLCGVASLPVSRLVRTVRVKGWVSTLSRSAKSLTTFSVRRCCATFPRLRSKVFELRKSLEARNKWIADYEAENP
jgi:hypothetical protein